MANNSGHEVDDMHFSTMNNNNNKQLLYLFIEEHTESLVRVKYRLCLNL